MKEHLSRNTRLIVWQSILLVFLLGVWTTVARAANLSGLSVIGVAANGMESPVAAYRWLVEKDKTYHVQTDGTGAAISTVFDPNWDQLNDDHPGGETLSVSFHQSYMPVVGKGCVGYGDIPDPAQAACNEVVPTFENNTQYYVTVEPRSGASIGGASFKTDGAGSPIGPITVYVNRHPIPTAQITVLVFHDNNPINNAPDLPEEQGGTGPGQTDMTGFTIVVEDAGGHYGISAGTQTTDLYGNLLGTTYNPDGTVSGYQPLITGPDGILTIKNLAPGKYGISVVPPAGQGWQQTSTIEGTKINDAWVKANEPPYFAEFGPPGYHTFFGFVKEFNNIPTGGGTDISGQIVNLHMSRPPDYAFYNGSCFGHTTPWVGLNDLSGGGVGVGIYAAQTTGDCEFTIPSVPDGNYELTVWDSNLDLIFAFYGITITDGVCSTPNGSCNIGQVPVFQWFHRQELRVFDDVNGNGIWDDIEGPGALETGFNIRWRDGSVNQANISDGNGAFTFDEVFPFFNWLVAEVDFARFQATGLTVVVDEGGPIPASFAGPAPLDDNDITFGRAINPQDQTNPLDPLCTSGVPGDPTTDICNEGTAYRVEHGPVLLQGFQGFIGQTSAFLWGKRHYPNLCEDGLTECTTDTECAGIGTETCSLVGNGGITGIIFYDVTRAENDPELAGAEPWEPGIPGVTVNLYDATGTTLLNTTVTDSWDAAIPTGCKWGDGATGPFAFDPDGTGIGIGPFPQDCYDGLRVFNQARPAVFDGGYAFDAVCSGGMTLDPDEKPYMDADGNVFCDATLTSQPMSPMPIGDYIVEVVPPPGYEIYKPEDKNVDFGDEYVPPVPELLPPTCVGSPHLIPPYLTLFPDEMIPAPFNGTERPLCDRKLVTLSNGANAAADFFLFTEVPIAAHGVGFILDDTTNEFNPNSPNFGEKYAPPFMPITIRDWTGRVISKTLSDQYGVYNFLAPSTFTKNIPSPSGVSPNMLTACMNDPGDDPNNPDPNWNQLYSTFCYTLQYMPGITTYLDTPVVPVAAFTGPDQFPLDCEYPDGTPRIYSVDVQTNGVGGGPYIPVNSVTTGPQPGRGVFTSGDQTITITSMGHVTVSNPEYCNPAAGACPAGVDLINKFIDRDYSFGGSGTVTLGSLGTLTCTWGEPIYCTIPAGTYVGPVGSIGARQLMVNRTGGLSTESGISVQFGLRNLSTVRTVIAGQSIQTAIENANANDLILVQPGVYNEMVVMWKPVQLQGWGEGSTIINAVNSPAEKLQAWRVLVDSHITNGDIDLLNGQDTGLAIPEPTQLLNEEGAGILVLAKAIGNTRFNLNRNQDARIDGLTIKGASTGGGIIVNGYVDFLQISNNRIANNSGFYGGGIRVGHPFLTDPDNLFYVDADNDYVSIHHNQVVLNGSLDGAGAGISMCTGSDSYRVTDNWVCGNFTQGQGGGIGHLGLSNRAGNNATPVPLIKGNKVIFNETFLQGQTVSGGGIFVGGATPLVAGTLTPGAGNVQVIANLILGNADGAGDGGGMRLAMVNGADVAAQPDNPAQWFGVDVFNNMIANNVTGLAGGGISLQDAVKVRIIHNTIANNDSLGTAGEAFAPGSPSQSTPQPGAGIATRAHSTQLAAASGSIGTFSNPIMADNIIWQNRQFFFYADTTSGCVPGDPTCVSTFGLCPDLSGSLVCPGGNTVVYNDLGVIGTAGALTCTPGTSCILTGGSDPLFVAEYVNGDKSSIVPMGITTSIQTPAAFDEGGNFIRPRFGPLSLYYDDVPNDGDPGTLFGDYHITTGSPAIDAGTDLTATYPDLATDYDNEPRPQGGAVDIGSDEAE